MITLRLVTLSTEQVGPDFYQPTYKTFDLVMPPELEKAFEHRQILGVETIRAKNPEPIIESINQDEVINDEVVTEE